MVTKKYNDMKAEEVIITHNEMEESDKWDPRIERLPVIIQRDLDKGLNREEKKLRRKAQLRAVLHLAAANNWTICRSVYDEKRDIWRNIYRCV